MKRVTLRSALAILAFAIMAPLIWAAPTSYSFQTIIFPGDTFTQTLGINNRKLTISVSMAGRAVAWLMFAAYVSIPFAILLGIVR